MPELSASGDIFRLDAQAGFDEGIVRGEVGAGARLNFQSQFELCHGIRGALSATAIVDAQVQLAGMLLLAGYAEGEALAAAGLSIDSGVQLDLFDSFGFSAEASAFAELAVAGRAIIGLTFEDIARAARPLLSDLSYDLFIYFLNEVDAVAGVWGKAAFAAMAKARFTLKGSLADDHNAGFVCEAGAEAGAAAGAGYEFYAALRLRNPKRFFLNASERVTRELTTAARRLLPAELASLIEALELLLPTALNSAYELGQLLPLNTLLPPEQAIMPFISNFSAQLQRYSLDKFAEAGTRLLEIYLKLILKDAIAQLTPAARNAARDLIATVKQQLQQPVPIAPLEALGKLLDVLMLVAPSYASDWRRPLTITWLAVAVAEALRTAVGQEQASASAGLIGLGSIATDAVAVPLPLPPIIVRQELNAFFDPDPPRVEVRHAVGYLAASGASLAYTYVPGMQEMLAPLLSLLDLRAEDLIEAAVSGVFGGNIVATTLYQHLRTFAKNGIDAQIQQRLLPELRRRAGGGSDAVIWINEVAEPSLGLLSNFVFARLDTLVAGSIHASDVSPFAASFRSALSAVMGELFVRNAVVAADIIREHALDGLENSLRDLAAVVRARPNHPAVMGARQIATSLLPPGVPLPTTYPLLVARLAGDLFAAAAAGVGADVYTPARRTRLRELQRHLLLSLDGAVDYKSGSEIEAFFRQVAECAFLPDPDASMELAKLQVMILAEQAGRMLPLIEEALARFFLDFSRTAVDDLNLAASEFLKGIQKLAEDTWNTVQDLAAQLVSIGRELEETAQNLSNELERTSDVLSSLRRRTEVLAAVLLYGIEQAERLARAAPGFDLLPVPARQIAIDTAVGAFRTAFGLVKPALNAALASLGDIAGDIPAMIDVATDLDNAVEQLATQIRNKVEIEVNRQLRTFGVVLPRELGAADIAHLARDIISDLPLVHDALRACLAAKKAKKNAQVRNRDTAMDKARAESRYKQAILNRDNEIGGALAVRILAPARIVPPPRFNWLYHGPLRVRLVIEGARRGFVDSGPKRRIWLAMNGKPIYPPPDSWSFENNTLHLNTPVPASALRRGMNLLECSVVDGQGNMVRASVGFAWQSGVPAPSPEVSSASVLAPSTLSATTAQSESLVLVNRTSAAVNLAGWSVSDEERNRFVFPSIST